MRIATYNVEWFDSLFDESDQPRLDGTWSSRWNVTRAEQLEALAHVFGALDADAILVIEAPDHSSHRSTVAALETFAAETDLRSRAALIGYSNDTQQEIALLYDPDVLTARHVPATIGAPRFDMAFRIDLDIDARLDNVRWSKPPLEVEIETRTGTRFRMIGVHAKSKSPHGARSPEDARRIAIANRRKQLAQCIWLRRRIDAHLTEGTPLVVLGDFNDGPGLDEYEQLFGRSGVEIVLGEAEATPLYDPHAEQALQSRLAASPVTARFYNRETKRYLSALLDYIMVSPDLRAQSGPWRIWHPFDDPECYSDTALRDALLTASDHFPVTCDLAL